MRLINADAIPYKRDIAVTERFLKFGAFNGKIVYSVTKEEIDAMPTVDAVPVRHGTWKTVEDWDGDEHYQCSECGAEFVLIEGTPNDNDYLYCSHCGARMDGKDGDA